MKVVGLWLTTFGLDRLGVLLAFSCGVRDRFLVQRMGWGYGVERLFWGRSCRWIARIFVQS